MIAQPEASERTQDQSLIHKAEASSESMWAPYRTLAAGGVVESGCFLGKYKGPFCPQAVSISGQMSSATQAYCLHIGN